ncbi:hypothetical protein ACWCQQ_32040 [Streptomyces sp. NPDC002143]
MAVLVDKLLLLARLEQGQALEGYGAVDLYRVCKGAVADARLADQDREVRFEGDPCEYMVDGSPTRLKQVVVNLFADVRAQIPPGAPARLGLREEGDEVLIEVVDTGPRFAGEPGMRWSAGSTAATASATAAVPGRRSTAADWD